MPDSWVRTAMQTPALADMSNQLPARTPAITLLLELQTKEGIEPWACLLSLWCLLGDCSTWKWRSICRLQQTQARRWGFQNQSWSDSRLSPMMQVEAWQSAQAVWISAREVLTMIWTDTHLPWPYRMRNKLLQIVIYTDQPAILLSSSKAIAALEESHKLRFGSRHCFSSFAPTTMVKYSGSICLYHYNILIFKLRSSWLRSANAFPRVCCL